MTLSQLQVNPATMLIFAALNSDANTLGNNSNSAFTAEFTWGSYTFKVKSKQDRIIYIALMYDDFRLICLKRPIGHGIEDAIAACNQFFTEVIKLAREHFEEVDMNLFSLGFEQCRARFDNTFIDVLNQFKSAEVTWLKSNYYMLVEPDAGILYISDDQYKIYSEVCKNNAT